MEILSLIRSNGDISWCHKVPNYVRIPWLDVCGPGVKLVDENQSPRLFSSHLPIQFFPKSFFSSKAKVSIFYTKYFLGFKIVSINTRGVMN